MIRSFRKIERPYIAILGLLFTPLFANALVIADQTIISSSQNMQGSTGEIAVKEQLLGTGLFGTAQSFTIAVSQNGALVYPYTLGVYQCDSNPQTGSPTTTISGLASCAYTTITTQVIPDTSQYPAFFTATTTGYDFLFNKWYVLELGYAGSPDQITVYGNSTGAANCFEQDFATGQKDFCDFPDMYYVIDTNATSSSSTSGGASSFSCPLPLVGDLCAGFSGFFRWAFIPPQSTWDQFTTLKDDLKNKAPFGYFTSAVSAISGITGSSSPSFAIASSSPLMTYIFNPLRTGLAWLIYFASALWIYKRLTKVHA